MPETNGDQDAVKNDDDLNDANFDDWNGYSGSLFAGLNEDAEDKDADAQLAKVEEYIDGRRRQQREQKAKELNKRYEEEHTDISSKFKREKRDLASISIEEWECLPESLDLVKMNKKKRSDFQRYTPVPDSVLQSAAADS